MTLTVAMVVSVEGGATPEQNVPDVEAAIKKEKERLQAALDLDRQRSACSPHTATRPPTLPATPHLGNISAYLLDLFALSINALRARGQTRPKAALLLSLPCRMSPFTATFLARHYQWRTRQREWRRSVVQPTQRRPSKSG